MAAEPPISAVVVCRNEASLLPRCLSSLAFCDERIVVDLESSDDSVEAAERLGARVLRERWVPIVERARDAGRAAAANDWVLFVDPDEEVSPGLARDIVELVARADPTIGAVTVPCRFFCKGRPLKGTVWGGPDVRIRRLFHRGRITERRPDQPNQVHTDPFALQPGMREEQIPLRGDNHLEHYWIDDWAKFFAKHRRYVRFEGEAYYARGERFGWVRALGRVPLHLYDSFVRRRGYRDGLRGLFLSAFWAAYNLGAILSLRSYERGRRSA